MAIPRKALKKEWKNITFNLVFMFLSALTVVLFYKEIILANIILLAIAAIGLYKWKSKLSLSIFIIFGLIFGIAEIIISKTGPWQYLTSDFLNIPSYLFILWGNTAVFIHQMIRELRKLGIKENKI